MELSIAFRTIHDALKSTRTPTLLEALYPHLPRPRLLRSLLDRDLVRMKQFPPPPGKVITLQRCYGEVLDHRHNMHWPYVVMFVLNSKRYERPECGRRGCTARWVSQCSACKKVKYCTAQCQKVYVVLFLFYPPCTLLTYLLNFRDWAEHKHICGLRMWLDNRELGLPEEEWPLPEARCGVIRLMFPGKTASYGYWRVVSI